MRQLRQSLCGIALLLALAAAEARAAAPEPDSLLTASLPDTTVVRRAPRVPWLTDRSWSDLVAGATEAGRPILIDFTASWCGPCKLLDVMVFTEKAVITELADVVTVKVDIDHPGADALPTQFAIEVIPTLVWCDASGRERDRFTGYVSSAEFLGTIAAWREGFTLDQALAQRQAAAPESPTVLLEVARRQAKQGRAREAEISYRRLMNLRHRAAPDIIARGMLGLAALEHDAGRGERAAELTRRATSVLLQPTVDSPLDERLGGLLEVTMFQAAVGDTSGSLDTWQRMVALDDRNAVVLEGFARAALSANVRLQDATRAALRATVFSDKDAAVIAVLAECYYRRRMLSRAERWISQAITRDPSEPRYVEQQEKYAAARRNARVRYGR